MLTTHRRLPAAERGGTVNEPRSGLGTRVPNNELRRMVLLALSIGLAGTGLVGLGVDLFNGVEPDPIPPDVFTAMMAVGFGMGFFVWLKR